MFGNNQVYQGCCGVLCMGRYVSNRACFFRCENLEMNKSYQQVGLSSNCFVLFFSLKASQCVGLSRKLHSWRKCHPKHSSRSSLLSVCLSHTPPTQEKSDHVSRLSQLCQRLRQIKSFCVFLTGSALLQGVHVAQTQCCCDVVPMLENTI